MLQKKWLDMSLNVRNNWVTLITIKDDSMKPTLRMWWSDPHRSEKIPQENNSQYVFQLDNELVAKQIQRKMNGSLVVKNDNPN